MTQSKSTPVSHTAKGVSLIPVTHRYGQIVMRGEIPYIEFHGGLLLLSHAIERSGLPLVIRQIGNGKLLEPFAYASALYVLVGDPFIGHAPCQHYGSMHTASCIELNDRSPREICTCNQ